MDKMTFSQACGMIYEKQLNEDLKREAVEGVYMNQAAFGNQCRARGKAISYNAEDRVDNFKGLAIALHREMGSHEDDKQDYSMEIEWLENVMPEEDILLAQEGVTVFGWWKP